MLKVRISMKTRPRATGPKILATFSPLMLNLM